MKTIFSYDNFRSFLKDFYIGKKSLTADFSYQKFSKQAGLKSPNYLALVINGQRNLTVQNIFQFSKALGLRSDEQEFFETLVLTNQAKIADEKKFYQNRLRDLKTSKSLDSFKKTPEKSVSEWYSPAIMVLANGRTESSAIEKIKSELKIDSGISAKALSEMLNLGILAKDENGIINVSQQTTYSDKQSISRIQENFLLSQLTLSRKAFQKTYIHKKSKFLSHTLTVPRDSLEILLQRFVALTEELTCDMDRITPPGEEKVAQINVQIFHPEQWE